MDLCNQEKPVVPLDEHHKDELEYKQLQIGKQVVEDMIEISQYTATVTVSHPVTFQGRKFEILIKEQR